MVKKFYKRLYEKKNIKKRSFFFRIKKSNIKKMISYISKGKVMIICLIAELIKKTLYRFYIKWFMKPYECSGG